MEVYCRFYSVFFVWKQLIDIKIGWLYINTVNKDNVDGAVPTYKYNTKEFTHNVELLTNIFR